MLLGRNDLKQYMLPHGVDPELLIKRTLADGTTYEQVTNEITIALDMNNQALTSDPVYGGMLYFTNEAFLEYRSDAGSQMERRTEYGRGDPRRGQTGGHMLPIESFDFWLGWTFDYLEKARRIQIQANIQEALGAIADNWRRRPLERFFDNTFYTLATSAKDAPFVNGTYNELNYTPPRNGQSFSNTHNHFGRFSDDASGRASAFNAGVTHLREHGIFGPYDVIVPEADIDDWAAVSGFIKPDRGIHFTTVDATARASILADERYFGIIEGKSGVGRLWSEPRLPTNYMGLYRSFGVNDPRNPLAVNYGKRGVGAVLMRGEGFREYPLENAQIIQEYGFGVNGGRFARINGYAAYFNSAGDYVKPTIG